MSVKNSPNNFIVKNLVFLQCSHTLYMARRRSKRETLECIAIFAETAPPPSSWTPHANPEHK